MCCLVFNEKRYVTEASWRGNKSNISFNITLFSLLKKIKSENKPTCMAIKINAHPTHPPNRQIISLYDNFAVTRVERHLYSIELVMQ